MTDDLIGLQAGGGYGKKKLVVDCVSGCCDPRDRASVSVDRRKKFGLVLLLFLLFCDKRRIDTFWTLVCLTLQSKSALSIWSVTYMGVCVLLRASTLVVFRLMTRSDLLNDVPTEKINNDGAK
jgi:hypothetical protein